MMNHINGLVLPREVLLQIFELLGPDDLKTAVLVCQQWRELGEGPRLWTWAVVSIGTMEDLQKVDIERLGMLQEIKVLDKCYHYDEVECIWMKKTKVNELFKVILKIPTVTRISGLDECEGISGVDPQLLVSLGNRLEKLTLWELLTYKQIELLLSTMAENTNVKELEVNYQHHVARVNPVVFASAISNVVDVVLMNEDITSEQMEALFAVIYNEDRPLRKLKVYDYSTRCDIDPALFGLVINRLEEFGTYSLRMSAAQITAVIKNLVQGESRLKTLFLADLDAAVVEELDQDLVRRAQEKVGEFYCVEDQEEDDGGEGNEEGGED